MEAAELDESCGSESGQMDALETNEAWSEAALVQEHWEQRQQDGLSSLNFLAALREPVALNPGGFAPASLNAFARLYALPSVYALANLTASASVLRAVVSLDDGTSLKTLPEPEAFPFPLFRRNPLNHPQS